MSELYLRCSMLLIDVSLKALLLAAVAGGILRLSRVRRSNLRHAAWVGVLGGMIALPVLSAVLPAIPVPVFRGRQSALPSRETMPLPDAELATAHKTPAATYGATGTANLPERNEAMNDFAGLSRIESRSDPRSESSSVSVAGDLANTDKSVAPWAPVSARGYVSNRLPVVGLTIWALGTLIFWARLLLAIHVTRRMVQRSTPICAETDARLRNFAGTNRAAGRAVNAGLRESSDISVPLTTGIIRPQIVLPLDWTTWPEEKLRNVLIHEFTHIQRRDCLTALAAGVTATHYWFHPLAWWLRRKLAVLAEDCCDDAAIGAAGERTAYARHLLEFASVLCQRRSRLHYVGLSMARRSNVERRILSILDTDRPLSQRLPRAVSLLLVAAILPLIAVAAALQPAGESSTKTDPQAGSVAAQKKSSDKAETATPPKSAAPAGAPAPHVTQKDSEEKEYHGKVVGADGQPLAGAEIWFAVLPYESPGSPAQGTLRRMAASDSHGDFSFGLKPLENADQFPIDWTLFAWLAAKAPGHGYDWLPLRSFENGAVASEERITLWQKIDDVLGQGRSANRTLKLPREAPVHGRLVDLEGRPLKGVAVSVERIQNANRALLREGFAKASRNTVDKALRTTAFGASSLDRRDWQTLIPPVKTDDNGEFSLSGLGRDQVATVTLSGERVEAERFFIVGAEMETKLVPHLSMYPNGAKDTFVGVSFSHAVGPAIPVSGVVTEFKTGEPIANATVFVERLFSGDGINASAQLRLQTSHIRALTDEQGRYALTGIPPGKGHVLNVVPPTSEPWLIASQTISLDPVQPTASVNVQVFRGIWIEGRVTDADTGEGIKGCVDYLALQSNRNIPQEFGLQDGWQGERFLSDEAGRYRTAGLPGPGVLLVRSFGKKMYPLSVGAEKIEGYDPEINYIPTTPTGMPLSNWHLVLLIDPNVGAEPYHCDMTLSAGASLVGRIVGPNDSPAAYVEALGLVEKGSFFTPLTDDKFTVTNYQPDEPRDLFFKTADGSLVGHLHLEGQPPADLIVRLQPSVTVRGRLIETETEEPAAGYGLYCDSSKKGEFRIDDTKTTEKAWFIIKGLLAGNVYEMNAFNAQLFSNGKNRFTIDLSSAKPGDFIELGDVTGKNAKRKE
ncbi:MAG TPA: M56 family metallopeptidase [Pirellulales bacterium]